MEDIQLLNTIKMKLGGRFWQCVTGLQKCMSFHLPGSTLLTIIVQYSNSALYGFSFPPPYSLLIMFWCEDWCYDRIFVNYTLFVPGSELAIITRSKRLWLVPLSIHEMVSDLPNYHCESVSCLYVSILLSDASLHFSKHYRLWILCIWKRENVSGYDCWQTTVEETTIDSGVYLLCSSWYVFTG